MDYNERSYAFRLFLLVAKFFRSIWVVFLTIVLIITVFYGIVLNSFGSQAIAILVCVVLLGVIMFLSMIDIREENKRFFNGKNGGSVVSRASSKKK